MQLKGLSGKEICMRTIRTLLVFLVLAIPAALFGQISVSIMIGPPALPVYEQPICPGDGYLWTPGYWAYDDSVSDYFWVDGAWVMAPEEGLLWTPGYWGWRDGGFFFNDGYWGPEVGFYGGINYGFGYFGEGYGGGRWDRGHFFYNRSVNNVDITRNHNVYNTVIENRNENRVSFNGGSGGISVRASSQQESAMRQRHLPPVAAQTEHRQAARSNPELRATSNHGKPPTGTTALPVGYNDHQMAPPQRATEPSPSPVRGAAPQPRVEAPVMHSDNAPPRAVIHPKDLPPIVRPEPSNSGNIRADQKYQQQQDKLITKQTQERQNLQQKQDSQRRPNANPAQTQQLDQRHSQQTQQQSQKHQAQQQSLQTHQPKAEPKKQQ
jgi:hypothetical protein